MKALTDRQLAEAWLGFFGVTTGVRLMGWCAITEMRIPPGEGGRDAILRYGQGHLTTRYRNLHHLEAFVALMARRGWTVAREGDASPAWLSILEAVRT